MKKLAIMVLVALALLIASCTIGTPVRGEGNIVTITITENGLSVDGVIVVENFYSGARAEAIYRVNNASGEEAILEIWTILDVDTAKHDNARGYVKAPNYISGWIEYPPFTVIPLGEARDVVVALQMPKDAEKPADKIAFQTGVANKPQGQMQLAINIWWLVSMR